MRISFIAVTLGAWCAATTVGLSAASQSWVTAPKSDLLEISKDQADVSYRTKEIRGDGVSSLVRFTLRGTLQDEG